MMIETNSRQGIAFAAAFLSLVSVQIGASIGKALFPILSAEGVTLTRLALAACFLWIVYKPWRDWNRQTNWKNLIIYGAILTLMNTLIYKAFSYMSVGIAISIEVLGPLTVAILMSKNKLDYFWGALSLIGLLFLPMGNSNNNFSFIGMAYALVAAVGWGLYVIYGSKVAQGGGSSVATGMFLAALFATPLGASHIIHIFDSYTILLTCLLMAMLASAIPFILDMVAMKKLHPRVFGILVSASPAVSALAGWLILDERLNHFQIIGITIIMASCAGCSYFSYKRKSV
ncbi:EamA family transporter [Acinetobacter nosocomialis]|uniref:EamA family transporter n=1 Tax=Acinetobacter nosocomialis TaxID=106654 RepID=UPI00244C8CBF|nr:EamA family transporter [Acinetobacter nosocomialis]MDH2592502.1 EamA family transporter [Acinetobacter nosocomialis]